MNLPPNSCGSIEKSTNPASVGQRRYSRPGIRLTIVKQIQEKLNSFQRQIQDIKREASMTTPLINNVSSRNPRRYLFLQPCCIDPQIKPGIASVQSPRQTHLPTVCSRLRWTMLPLNKLCQLLINSASYSCGMAEKSILAFGVSVRMDSAVCICALNVSVHRLCTPPIYFGRPSTK